MADNFNIQSNQATSVLPTSPLKEILTIEEAAEFLSVSKSYLYKQTSAQAIPHYKPTGKRCYFKRSELEAWILVGRISTKSDLAKRRNGRMPIASKPGSDVRRGYLFQCGTVTTYLRTPVNDAEDDSRGVG